MQKELGISKLSLKSMKYNKRKSVLMALTVTLAVCLITVIFQYLYSSRQRNQEIALQKNGIYHAEYDDLSNWQLQQLEKNTKIMEVYSIVSTKDIHINNEQLIERQIIPQIFFTEGIGTMYSLYDGREPKESNEIVMDKWVMETMGLPLEINQTITLEVEYANQQSGIVKTESMTFNIVGILNDISDLRVSNIAYFIFDKQFVLQHSINVSNNAKILMQSDINCKNELEDIESEIGIQNEQCNWNIAYLDAFNIELATVLKTVSIALIIIFVAAVVIYNILFIYVVQEIELFGTMKAIGFSKGQLKKFVMLESGVVGCLGSLLGVLAGKTVSCYLIPVLGNVENVSEKLKVYFPFWIGLMAFVCGMIVILIGIQKPMKTVSEISEIEAMNYNPNSNEKHYNIRKKRKNNISLWDLIEINLIGNWKKTRIAILSLVMTGLLFIVTASIVNGMNLDNLLNLTIRGDYSLQLSETEARDKTSSICLEPDIILSIEKQDGVENVNPIMYDRLTWNVDDAEKYIHITDEFSELGIGFEDIDSVIYGYDDAFIEECLNVSDKINVSMEEMEKNNYAIVIQSENSNFRLNNTICMQTDSDSAEMVEFKIVGILQNNITYRGYRGAGNDFIIHQNRFKEIGLDTRLQRAAISVDSGTKDRIQEYLESLTENNENMVLISYDDLMMEYEEQKKSIEISSYSLVVLILLISIFNLLNTSLSNIFSRKRELAMLEAIGLTRGQESFILQIEGIVLASLSGLFSILLGIPLGYVGFRVFNHSATYATYRMPIKAIMILLIGFVIVQIVITKFAQSRLEKESIIEKMKNRNL